MVKTKKTNLKKQNSPLSGLLIVGIAIISFLFILSVFGVLFERPEYNAYCSYEPRFYPKGYEECDRTPVVPNCGQAMVREEVDEQGCIINYTCDYCNLDYQKAQDMHSKNVFIAALIIGISLIIGSSFIIVGTIQNGIFISAIVTIFYGTVNYWRQLGKYLQLIFLGIALVSILILAYKAQQKIKK